MIKRLVRKNLPVDVPFLADVDWEDALAKCALEQVAPFIQDHPRIYQLETTSICNLSCIMCPRQQGMKRSHQMMDMELYETILDRDMAWTKAVELFGFGEPFTDPMLGERIAMLHDRQIRVTIATNGLLVGSFPDSVIQSIDYLVYDVDALDEAQYLHIRKGGNYRLMLDSLERVLAIRENYTVLQFIDLEGDPGKCRLFKEKYEGRADEVRIKFYDSFAGQVSEQPLQKNVHCLEPFYGVSVWSNGDVVICDRDYNSIHCMGNLAEESLEEVWMGNLSRLVKGHHMRYAGETLALCAHCPEWRLTNLRNVPKLTVNMFKGGFL